MTLALHIRKLEKSDLKECIVLFRDTVHLINSQDYSPTQVKAWAPQVIDEEAWWVSLSANIAYVAIYDDRIVGFGDISPQGYFDRLYVHRDFQRIGIASALIQTLEEQARLLGIKEIHTEVSITAKPLAEAFGYCLIEQQIKEFNGETFINFHMKKMLV